MVQRNLRDLRQFESMDQFAQTYLKRLYETINDLESLSGIDPDELPNVVGRMVRTFSEIRDASSTLGKNNIYLLSQYLERLAEKLHQRKLPLRVSTMAVMVSAATTLRGLVVDIAISDTMDIGEDVDALKDLVGDISLSPDGESSDISGNMVPTREVDAQDARQPVSLDHFVRKSTFQEDQDRVELGRERQIREAQARESAALELQAREDQDFEAKVREDRAWENQPREAQVTKTSSRDDRDQDTDTGGGDAKPGDRQAGQVHDEQVGQAHVSKDQANRKQPPKPKQNMLVQVLLRLAVSGLMLALVILVLEKTKIVKKPLTPSSTETPASPLPAAPMLAEKSLSYLVATPLLAALTNEPPATNNLAGATPPGKTGQTSSQPSANPGELASAHMADVSSSEQTMAARPVESPVPESAQTWAPVSERHPALTAELAALVAAPILPSEPNSANPPPTPASERTPDSAPATQPERTSESVVSPPPSGTDRAPAAQPGQTSESVVFPPPSGTDRAPATQPGQTSESVVSPPPSG
ncbi:MAG: hypothetical protein HQL62_05825, partial [Magnetococcales bacterium]|nr:hypothetical protein [Magnetococcales bacterium]